MNVLLATANSHLFSGGANQMVSLAKFLVQNKQKATVVLDHRPTKYPVSLSSPVPYQLKRFRFIHYNRDLGNFIADSNIDAIICHDNIKKTVLDTLLIHDLKVPMMIHRGHSEKSSKTSLQVYKHPYTVKILTVSEKIGQIVREQIEEKYRGKVKVVYSGTDTNIFQPLTKNKKILKEFNISESDFIIGMVAHVRPYKRVDLFLKAYKLVKKKYPNSKFLVVGKVKESYINNAAKLLNKSVRINKDAYYIGNDFIFTDLRTDIPQLISVFDISVNCSDRYEGITGAIRESLAMEVPVICSGIGGNSELVQKCETGILLTRPSANELARKIFQVRENLSDARKLAKVGRSKVIRYFSAEERNQIITDLLIKITKDCKW